MDVPPPIDRKRFKEVMGTGSDRFKKFDHVLIFLLQRAMKLLVVLKVKHNLVNF